MGHNEAASPVFSALFGILITEVQGGPAYTMIQVHACGTVLSVEMIGLDAFDVTGGIHQTIGRIGWDGHNTIEIVHKKAIGMPLAGVVPSLGSIAHCLEAAFYVLDEVIDLAGAV